MKKSILKKILKTFGVIAIILTVVPLIPWDHWWIRVFDFPHIQLTILTLAAILFYLIRFDIRKKGDYVFISVLIICFAYQFSKIYAYTRLADVEVHNSTTSSSKKSISLFTANILQENEERDKLIKQIKEIDADIIVLTENNTKWTSHIKERVSKDYSYRKEIPLENTYGMLLYSKLELVNPTIEYLIDDRVPSIHTKVILKTNDTIQLYAIHPTPPVPQENMFSTDRDAEMMKVARLSLSSNYPVVVLGDFNDVAWSSTNLLFQRVGGLLDVRIGRGFYNTFNATHPVLRWPLDHIFVTSEFRLKELKSCETIDSDHFPYYVQLTFEPDLASEQEPKPPTKEELELARLQIEKEQNK